MAQLTSWAELPAGGGAEPADSLSRRDTAESPGRPGGHAGPQRDTDERVSGRSPDTYGVSDWTLTSVRQSGTA